MHVVKRNECTFYGWPAGMIAERYFLHIRQLLLPCILHSLIYEANSLIPVVVDCHFYMEDGDNVHAVWPLNHDGVFFAFVAWSVSTWIMMKDFLHFLILWVGLVAFRKCAKNTCNICCSDVCCNISHLYNFWWLISKVVILAWAANKCASLC